MRAKKHQSTALTDWTIDAYADPVRYLRSLGIEAELVESVEADLSSAA
jgi:hypothetical protein